MDIVNDGESAVSKAMSGNYDLVLMDMQLPVMSGLDAASKLRDSGLKAPIVALTAFASRSDRERCLEAGCIDHIAKPIDVRNLVESVVRVLARAESPASVAAP